MIVRETKKENIFIVLFFLIILLSQGIRGELNTLLNISILNYDIIPIIIIICSIIKENKIKKLNIVIIIIITGLSIISFIFGQYDKSTFFRGIMTFVLPLYIFLLDYKNIKVEYVLKNIIKMFNILIYISLVYSIYEVIEGVGRFGIEGRTGGIIGHPLTAAWYYAIYISLNCIYCRYIQEKKDIYIAKDIIVSLVGITLATGRISLIIGILLSLIYIFSCVKSKIIKYILIPLGIVGFLCTPMVNNLIWEKFRATAGSGDITNGRLWAIREMEFFKLYPDVLSGGGIGYSNYISQYLLGTFNFENPILMFAFDYGIFTVILLIIVTVCIPTIKFFKNKQLILLMNFLCIYIIPYTYNGLGESTGLFMVLMYIVSLNLMISENIMMISNKNEIKLR